MSAPESKQIFLSHCVRSTGQRALQLQKKLDEKGFTVFNCVNLESGDKFREEIVYNVCRCQVFIIFLDKAWSESEECKKEYLVAEGHYNRNKDEHHTIIPIIIDGFEWINKEKSTVLSYSIILQNQGLEVPQNPDESDWIGVFDRVVERCETLIQSDNSVGTSSIVQTGTSSIVQTTSTSLQSQPYSLTEFFAIVTDYITCGLCQKVFKLPTMMACTHTFCYSCLFDEWTKKFRVKGGLTDAITKQIHCPKCKIESDFTTKYEHNELTADKLVEIYKRRKLDSDRGMWEILDDLYDYRVLCSDSPPTDILKFWSFFTQKQRESFGHHINRLGTKLMENKWLDILKRSRKLYKAAFILCNLTMYSDAKDLIFEALLGMRDKNEEYYQTRVLWFYVCLTEYEYIELDDRISASQLRLLIDECEAVLKQGKHHLEPGLFVKTIILKLTAILFLSRKDKCYKPDMSKIHLLVAEAEFICLRKLPYDYHYQGFKAELWLKRGLLSVREHKDYNPEKETLPYFVKAKKLSTETYGEISDQMARICSAMAGCLSPSLAPTLRHRACFIYRQLYGSDHAYTLEAARLVKKCDLAKYCASVQIPSDGQLESNDVAVK